MTIYHTSSQDSHSYSSGYEIFLTRTNFREKVLKKFKETFPSSLRKLGHIKILDIGCGNGEMTKEYIKIIKEICQDIQISVFLIEPSVSSLAKARDEVSLLTKEIITINKTADEYLLENLNESFDLIIASYVFYHISSKSLFNIIRMISKDGALSIMMGSKTHPLRKHPLLSAISKHGDSEELKQILSNLVERDAILLKLDQVKTELDLNGFWKDGLFSREGEKFFSFSFNVELNSFPSENLRALNSILFDVFSKNNGIVHPTHELIWVQKK